MGEFNSDDHYIYHRGQKSLRRNGVALMVKKGAKCSTWMQSQKQQWSLFISIQYHSNPNLCPNAEEAEVEQYYEDLQDLLELKSRRDVLFIIGDWNAK